MKVSESILKDISNGGFKINANSGTNGADLHLNGKDVDIRIKHCPECLRTYEKGTHGGFHSRKYWIYYAKGNIPTYGKDKKVCPECSVL